jgi:Predicted nucleic acid-binding protein, contains PIN domain
MYFPSLAIKQAEIDHIAVIELAHKKKLTTYDASYLWLAGELQAELVTLDKKLLAYFEVSGLGDLCTSLIFRQFVMSLRTWSIRNPAVWDVITATASGKV